MRQIINGKDYAARLIGETLHYRVGWPEKLEWQNYLEPERVFVIGVYAPDTVVSHGIPPSPIRHQKKIPVDCERVIFKRTTMR